MPTLWHYHHHHALLMRWYALDHEQFLSFSILFSSHHSGTSWSWSHLSMGCCSRTVEAFLDVWQTLIWPSCFWGSPMVFILWWTLCIQSGEVFSSLLTLTHIHLPPGECSWPGQLLWGCFLHQGKNLSVIHHSCLPGLLVLPSSPMRSLFKDVPNSWFGHT